MIFIDNKLYNKTNITELSRLTGKARPSIYKYIEDYNRKDYRSIPYHFIMLFNLIAENNSTKLDIVEYCKLNFSNVSDNDILSEVITLLKKNESKLDLQKIKKIIEGEL